MTETARGGVNVRSGTCKGYAFVATMEKLSGAAASDPGAGIRRAGGAEGRRQLFDAKQARAPRDDCVFGFGGRDNFCLARLLVPEAPGRPRWQTCHLLCPSPDAARAHRGSGGGADSRDHVSSPPFDRQKALDWSACRQPFDNFFDIVSFADHNSLVACFQLCVAIRNNHFFPSLDGGYQRFFRQQNVLQ